MFAYWNLALHWVVCRGVWHLEFLEDPLTDILDYQIYLLSYTFLCMCAELQSSSKHSTEIKPWINALWIFQSKDRRNTIKKKNVVECWGMSISAKWKASRLQGWRRVHLWKLWSAMLDLLVLPLHCRLEMCILMVLLQQDELTSDHLWVVGTVWLGSHLFRVANEWLQEFFYLPAASSLGHLCCFSPSPAIL